MSRFSAVTKASLFFCFGTKCTTMWQTVKINRLTFAMVFILLLYFAAMDVMLYRRVQELPPIWTNKTTDNLTLRSTISISQDDHQYYSPFEGISVKMMMMDQPNDYIHIPVATIFNKVTHFSDVFYFITPNMISLASTIPALLSAKFLTSNVLLNRQIGVLLFELRNFLDALDGAVFRSRQHLYTFVTDSQSLGGIVDGLADVIGFVAVTFGCFFYLKKNPARKSYSQNGGLLDTSEPNGGSAKQSAVHAMGAFGFVSVYAALAWNIYILRFHNTLESPMPTVESATLQNLILKSNCTWLFMWLWRFANSHGLFEILSLFIFIDKLWEFVTFLQSKGVVLLTLLIIFTELYYMDTKGLLEGMIQ